MQWLCLEYFPSSGFCLFHSTCKLQKDLQTANNKINKNIKRHILFDRHRFGTCFRYLNISLVLWTFLDVIKIKKWRICVIIIWIIWLFAVTKNCGKKFICVIICLGDTIGSCVDEMGVKSEVYLTFLVAHEKEQCAPNTKRKAWLIS